MTLYYETTTSSYRPSKMQLLQWERIADKENWRIVELANGYFQTEFCKAEDSDQFISVTRRETIEKAEAAIDETIAHYKERIRLHVPKVVKTFKNK